MQGLSIQPSFPENGRIQYTEKRRGGGRGGRRERNRHRLERAGERERDRDPKHCCLNGRQGRGGYVMICLSLPELASLSYHCGLENPDNGREADLVLS